MDPKKRLSRATLKRMMRDSLRADRAKAKYEARYGPLKPRPASDAGTRV